MLHLVANGCSHLLAAIGQTLAHVLVDQGQEHEPGADHCLRASASYNLRNCRQRAYWSAFDASESSPLASQKVNQSTVPPWAASRSWGRRGACSALGSQVNS